jgi:hypothetical protein
MKARRAHPKFKTLFPQLELDSVSDSQVKIAEVLADFLEVYPEFEDASDDSEHVLSVSGADWTIHVRGDLDADLEPVYEAIHTTYCPRVLVTSGYFATPYAALNKLSSLLVARNNTRIVSIK